MKPIGKRGKLVLLVRVLVVLSVTCFLYLAFRKDAIQEDYDKVHAGMKEEDLRTIFKDSRVMSEGGGGTSVQWDWEITFKPPKSDTMITVTLLNHFVTKKAIRHATTKEIWNDWMFQMGCFRFVI